MQSKLMIFTSNDTQTLQTECTRTAQRHLESMLENPTEGDRIVQTWKVYGNQKLPNYGDWKVCECCVQEGGYLNWTHRMTDKPIRES